MKNFLLFALCLVFISCASTSPNQEVITAEEQTEVNQAFEDVYQDFDTMLLMDDAQEYIVRRGDTLSSVAKNYYGKDNGYYFPLIMLASAKVILDPDLIQPGMTLTIPNLQKNLNDQAVRKNLKDYFTEIAQVYENKGNATSSKTNRELLKIANSL